MHKLIIEDDEGKAVVVPLIRDEIAIGRQEGNTIRLTERNVSRHHARLVRRDGRYVLEDLSSYIGTKVNGTRITAPVPLSDGDQVSIGEYRLAIKGDRPTTATMGYPAAPASAVPSPGVEAAASAVPQPAPPTATLPLAAAAGASAPPEPMEGAPTIPVRSLAEQGHVATSTPTVETPVTALPPARLLVMTQPFTGQEFILDRASLVIGRTQENDIVLNHKSISRHHAKIIRDGERYVVVDLESANGVRVNGAEYERVELQSGDVLELGHVRLRFASAGDAAVMERDAFRLGGRRNRTLLIGVGAAVVVTATVVLYLTSGQGEDGKDAHVAAPAATQAVAPADTADTLLARAREAYKQQKWGEALPLVTKAMAEAPGNNDALDLRRTIETEQQNASKIQAMQRAMEIGDYSGVMGTASTVSDGSVYKDQAGMLAQDARTKFVALHLAAADRRRGDGNCNEARREAQAVLALEADNQKAQDVISRCTRTPSPPKIVSVSSPRPAAARAPTPSAGRAAPRPVPVAARSEEPAPQPGGADADELLQQAQEAWLKGQYAVAIEVSRRALRARPGLSRAYQIIAVCSCSLRDAEQATRAYERLDDRNRQLVKQLCQKSGVNIE